MIRNVLRRIARLIVERHGFPLLYGEWFDSSGRLHGYRPVMRSVSYVYCEDPEGHDRVYACIKPVMGKDGGE